MNKILRNKLKKIYRQKKNEDAKVGRDFSEKINKIMSLSKDSEEYMNIVKELVEREPRFREEFPSFASFKNFVKRNKVNLSDFTDSETK